MKNEAKLNGSEPVEYQNEERECTDEELKHVDLLLKILRSDNHKSINALSTIMNQTEKAGFISTPHKEIIPKKDMVESAKHNWERIGIIATIVAVIVSLGFSALDKYDYRRKKRNYKKQLAITAFDKLYSEVSKGLYNSTKSVLSLLVLSLCLLTLLALSLLMLI